MGGDDERRSKRSWREIDRMRDGTGSGHGSRREEEPQKGTGYTKYKAELNRLFETGLTGDHVSGVMNRARQSTPSALTTKGDSNVRAKWVQACRTAESHTDFVAAIDAVLETGPLPDDIELLTRVVTHPREEVVLEALESIERLIVRNPLKRKASFVQHLYTLEQTAEHPEVLDAVNRLLEDLA